MGRSVIGGGGGGGGGRVSLIADHLIEREQAVGIFSVQR